VRDRGGGAIVNAWINGRRPAPGQGVYWMIKAAILSMTSHGRNWRCRKSASPVY
jgi:hypothetical protein